MNNDFDLNRFVEAQVDSFDTALKELNRGQKESHWMWFIFPQIHGLGTSATAVRYAIKSKAEAAAYLSHLLLRSRLDQCTQALLNLKGKSASAIMGFPDDMKLKSSMTLFATISETGSIYHQVLDQYFNGNLDRKPLDILVND